MFEKDLNQDLNSRKRKALICAIIATTAIALMYIILNNGKLYTFSGLGKDLNTVGEFFKKAKTQTGAEIDQGKDAVNKSKEVMNSIKSNN